MKHAKRIVLVPEDVLNHYEQKQKIETSPITSNMMHQDTAMSEILQSTDMSDVEKQKMYNANMESYLSLRRQKDDQISTVPISSVMPCGHARILILREHRNFFADCQRLMCPKILQETRKDGRKFKWMNQLFSRHPQGNHCQHYRV